MTAPHATRCVHGVPDWVCRTCSPEEILSAPAADEEPWLGAQPYASAEHPERVLSWACLACAVWIGVLGIVVIVVAILARRAAA